MAAAKAKRRAPAAAPLLEAGDNATAKAALRGVLAERVCALCGCRPAPFGYSVFLRSGQEGRWACSAHREEVKAMKFNPPPGLTMAQALEASEQ